MTEDEITKTEKTITVGLGHYPRLKKCAFCGKKTHGRMFMISDHKIAYVGICENCWGWLE